MAVGIAVGHFFPEFGKTLSPISTVFIRLIKSIIAPLLFATLVVGIASSGSAKAMGRIGLKAMIYFEIVTTAALVVGLVAVNLVKPGVGVTLEKGADAGLPQAHATFMGMLEHTFPSSIIDAMAKGEVLQMVVFCFLFGTACTVIGAKAQPVVTFLQSLADVMFEYTKYVMYVAPLGVGAAMAATVGSKGIGVLEGLGKLVLTLYGALLVFVVGVLGLVILIARIPLQEILALGEGAVFPGILNGVERGGATDGAHEHGEVRRAEAHRGVRSADGLQLQSRRVDAVPLAGQRVRGAGSGRRLEHRRSRS